MTEMDLRGKKVTVFGLKRSGASAAVLLEGMGADVAVTDMKTEGELAEYVGMLPPGVRLFLGGHPDEALAGADMVVVSPGVPLDIAPIRKAVRGGIRVLGELELFYQAVKERGLPVFAITGTNGKSTTTALLDRMLRAGGFRPLTGGNIGDAATGELLRLGEDFDSVVLEVSSFQLEGIEEFRPKISAILNLTPDHMDRYRSMDEYKKAKERVFLNQREGDSIVLNADDPGTMEIYDEGLKDGGEGPEVFFISRVREVKGVFSKKGEVHANIPGKAAGRLIKNDLIKIKGVHNLENAMAASAMALLAKCPADAVLRALMEFEGLPHRLEFVRELEGVLYVNDSKGTNVAATLKSLEGYSSPVILIAGGRDKEGDFERLRPLVREKVKAALLIGEASGKIARAIEGLTEIRMCGSLREAVSVSRDLASGGDVVLLSPACASFDMFRDFEDRGGRFKEEVMSL